MMIDRTQEDINQDRRLGELEKEIADLKIQNADLSKAQADHGSRLDRMKPLLDLLEHIQQITQFFHNIANMRRRQ